MSDLTHTRLREVLKYDPEIGLWIWRLRKAGVRDGQSAGYRRKDGTPVELAVMYRTSPDSGYDTLGYIQHGQFEVLADDGPWTIEGGEPKCTYEGRPAGTYFNCWYGVDEYESRWRIDKSKDFAKFTHWRVATSPPSLTTSEKKL